MFCWIFKVVYVLRKFIFGCYKLDILVVVVENGIGIDR